jgi:hypothetical protein
VASDEQERIMTYRQTTTNAAGLQADPTKPRYLHQFDGQCGISHQCKAVVVIDPEDREQVQRLYDRLGAGDRGAWWLEDLIGFTAALREFANPKPPKPDEPLGLGAVVRASWNDHFDLWLRTTGDRPGSDHVWQNQRANNIWRTWDDFPSSVEVLSAGYGADS